MERGKSQQQSTNVVPGEGEAVQWQNLDLSPPSAAGGFIGRQPVHQVSGCVETGFDVRQFQRTVQMALDSS